MKKSIKLASIILTVGLITSSAIGVVSEYNIAEATGKNIQNDRKVIQEVNVKNSEILKYLEIKYKNGEVPERDYAKIKSVFEQRWAGPQGVTKVVRFANGSFDLYLNSYYSYGLVGVSVAGATALLTSALAAAGISGGASLFAAGAVSNVLGLIAGTEVSRGIVIYFNKVGFQMYPVQVRSQ